MHRYLALLYVSSMQEQKIERTRVFTQANPKPLGAKRDDRKIFLAYDLQLRQTLILARSG